MQYEECSGAVAGIIVVICASKHAFAAVSRGMITLLRRSARASRRCSRPASASRWCGPCRTRSSCSAWRPSPPRSCAPSSARCKTLEPPACPFAVPEACMFSALHATQLHEIVKYEHERSISRIQDGRTHCTALEHPYHAHFRRYWIVSYRQCGPQKDVCSPSSQAGKPGGQLLRRGWRR